MRIRIEVKIWIWIRIETNADPQYRENGKNIDYVVTKCLFNSYRGFVFTHLMTT
jgi:hypothetical protein